jgi:hypothetical protein
VTESGGSPFGKPGARQSGAPKTKSKERKMVICDYPDQTYIPVPVVEFEVSDGWDMGLTAAELYDEFNDSSNSKSFIKEYASMLECLNPGTIDHELIQEDFIAWARSRSPEVLEALVDHGILREKLEPMPESEASRSKLDFYKFKLEHFDGKDETGNIELFYNGFYLLTFSPNGGVTLCGGVPDHTGLDVDVDGYLIIKKG